MISSSILIPLSPNSKLILQDLTDSNGVYTEASIKTYGDVVHTLIDDSSYNGIWKPKFIKYSPHNVCNNPPNLLSTDHVVGNVEDLMMNHWVEYYEKALVFNLICIYI